MAIGSGGYPTSYRKRRGLGSRMTPAGAPYQRQTFTSPNPYNKGTGYARPSISMGELVPYQSGPRGSLTAPSGTKWTGNRVAGIGTYPRPSPAMQRRMMGRLLAGAIGRRALSAYQIVGILSDLIEALGPWGITDEGGVVYDHPDGSQLMEKCEGNVVEHGPIATDGDCTGTTIGLEFWNDVPSWTTDGFGCKHWRYHEFIMFDALGRAVAKKAERWRLCGAGTPGPVTQAPPVVQPIPTALPAASVRLRGPVAPPRTTYRDPLPHRRVGERKKGLAQRGYALAAHVYGTVDEVREAVDVAHKCLGGKCKRKGAKGVLAKAADIARCAGTMNLSCLAVGLAVNQIEDLVIGRSQGAAGKASRGLRGGIGSGITGPAV